MIESLGISTVFDLRSNAEVAAAPRSTAQHRHPCPPPDVQRDVAQHRSMLARIVDGTLTKFDNDDMAAGYLNMLEGVRRLLH